MPGFCIRRISQYLLLTQGNIWISQVPDEHMPWSKTPVVTCILAISHAGLLPSAACRASAFSCVAGIILTTTTIHFSELNTEPAPLIHPASDSRCRAYPWTSLLTCWLSFSQVGLSRHKVRNHPLGGNNQFHGITPNPKVSDLPWHEHALVMHKMDLVYQYSSTSIQIDHSHCP